MMIAISGSGSNELTSGERWARYCEDAGRRGRFELTHRLSALNTYDSLLDK